MQKPSTLWPPPSDEMTRHVHASLRTRIRQMVHLNRGGKAADLNPLSRNTSYRRSTSKVTVERGERGPDGMPVDVGTTASAPPLNSPENQTISLVAKSGEILTIDQQIHLYTQNSLIVHPLVSPALSYLGGLPPLLVIASDKEVLRDEVIYM
jgi:acetyl esterase/lipase